MIHGLHDVELFHELVGVVLHPVLAQTFDSHLHKKAMVQQSQIKATKSSTLAVLTFTNNTKDTLWYIAGVHRKKIENIILNTLIIQIKILTFTAQVIHRQQEVFSFSYKIRSLTK